RSRRRRPRRKPTAKADGSRDATEATEPVEDTAAEPRRGRKGGARAPAKPAAKPPAKPSAEPKPARRRTARRAEPSGEEPTGPTRVRRPRTTSRRRREPLPVPPRVQDKVMLITERADRDQIAVLEDRVVVEHYITRVGARSMV